MPEQRVAVFKKETAEEMYRAFQYLKSSGILAPGLIQALMSGQPTLTELPIYFTNTSGETVPAYGCMQVVNTQEIGRQNYLQINKPVDTDGTGGVFLFNGHSSVAAGDEGVAQRGQVNLRAYVSGGNITALLNYRPTIGQWYLTQDDGGIFQAHGPDDIGEGVGKIAYLGAGGGGGKIEFEIDSVTTHSTTSHYNGLKVATVTVTVAPCNLPDLIGESVEVVDHSGCLLNEDNAELIGREGWAFWGIALSLKSGVDPGTLTPCHWAMDNICCP